MTPDHFNLKDEVFWEFSYIVIDKGISGGLQQTDGKPEKLKQNQSETCYPQTRRKAR